MNNVGVTIEGESPPDTAKWDVPADQLEEFLRSLNQPIPEILNVAVKAFRRDLPELLPDHYGEAVAYHGERRIGIALKPWILHQKCLAEGLDPREVLIVGIDPSTYADS